MTESRLKIGWGLVLTALTCHAGCAPSRPPAPVRSGDVVFEQSSSTAMIAYDRGDVPLAAKLYKDALRRAEAMDDPKAVEDSSYNLGACEMVLGQYDRARNHLEEARYGTARRRESNERIPLLLAKLNYLQERDADAELVARPLLNATSSLTRLQAQALITLIACDRKDLAAANKAGVLLQEMGVKLHEVPPAVCADIEKALGAIALLNGQPGDAANHYDKEAALLQAAHRYRDIVHALARSGAAHEQVGEGGAAADRYYRAARACAANDDILRASELAQKAFATAGKAGDLQLQHVVQNFISETRAGL